jgi:outer membrane immunogenic protein
MGVEYAFSSAWSANIEYDYMDFGTKRYDFAATSVVIPANTFTNWDINQRLHMMKIGLNYHFNMGDPVAVRY